MILMREGRGRLAGVGCRAFLQYGTVDQLAYGISGIVTMKAFRTCSTVDLLAVCSVQEHRARFMFFGGGWGWGVGVISPEGSEGVWGGDALL